MEVATQNINRGEKKEGVGGCKKGVEERRDEAWEGVGAKIKSWMVIRKKTKKEGVGDS